MCSRRVASPARLADPVSIGETPRVYSSGVAGRAGALVGGVIAVPLVAIGVPLVIRDVFNFRDSKVLIGTVVVIAVLGGLLLIRSVFITGPVRVQTDATEVRFLRGRRVIHRWARADAHFSSLVVRESTNGVRSGTKRNLIVFTERERTELLCQWFTAQTFNDLMADLAPVGTPVVEHGREQVGESGGEAGIESGGEAGIGAVGESGAGSARTPHFRSRTFSLDHERHPTRRSVWRWLTVITVVVVLGIVLVLLFSDSTGTSDGPSPTVVVTVVVVLGIVVACIAAVIAAARGRERRRVRRMPRTITVSASALQFDQTAFHYSQLSAIVATPPGYTASAKRLVLAQVSGIEARFELTLPASAASRYTTFPDYADFIDALGGAAPAGLVRFDLR